MPRVHRAAHDAEGPLGVDTESPTAALSLDESFGFAPERREIAYRKPLGD